MSLSILFISAACRKQSSREFIITDAPVIALTHVRVIDGNGSPAVDDQTILVEGGRIKSIGKTTEIEVPQGAKIFDLTNHTAIPGLVGMHNHLFYSTERGEKDVRASETFPKLYLAAGVTTIRTAGTFDLDDEVNTKRAIDSGRVPGPKIHLSSPYINYAHGKSLDVTLFNQKLEEWTAAGVATLKVYTNVGRDDLAQVIQTAHGRGLKVTGHLCATGFRDAAIAGIDNLEHGLLVDTEFYSGKQNNQCAERRDVFPELVRLDVNGPEVRAMIKELVDRKVAITSTLAIFEIFTGDQFQLDPRMQQVLTPAAYESCLAQMAHDRADPRWASFWQPLLKKEMEFEREFVRAGGLLMAGVDPTGWGGVVAGFGDQRQLELLVQAGFSPEEAIRIYTRNGAEFLARPVGASANQNNPANFGTLEVGKQADIVIIQGDPRREISQIRNVVIVFKDGVGFDPAKLIDSVVGEVGRR
ncbi:MAG TPA: amidohydrolase family protein [Pyrinomonadaceae bacterium]|nr:amidohydrolase family protein [Pyrinomonadaceae bacterium]